MLKSSTKVSWNSLIELQSLTAPIYRAHTDSRERVENFDCITNLNLKGALI